MSLTDTLNSAISELKHREEGLATEVAVRKIDDLLAAGADEVKRLQAGAKTDEERNDAVLATMRLIAPLAELRGLKAELEAAQAVADDYNQKLAADRGKWGTASERSVEVKAGAAGSWLKKALQVGNDPAGGYLDGPEVARQVIDLLRPATAFLESGPRLFTTSAEALELPAIIADPTVGHAAELGTEPVGAPTYGKIRLSLDSTAVQIPYSVELSQDTAIADIVGQQAIRAIAVETDRMAFEGSGVNTGIKRWTGIQTVDVATDGALPSNLDVFASAIAKIRAKQVGDLVFVMHPSLWGLLLKLKSLTTGSNQPLFTAVGGVDQAAKPAIFGCRVFFSGQMSVTEVQGSSGAVCTSVLCYDPAQVAYLRHVASPTLLRDPFSAAGTGTEILHARLRQAIGVLNPSAVCWIKGFKLA